MAKIKLAAVGFVILIGAAAVVAVFLVVSGNKVKKDVDALKTWKPEGRALELVTRKSKKIAPIEAVLQHEAKAVPLLVKAVQTWTPEEAQGAMIALGLLQAPEGIPALVEVLKMDEGAGGYAAAAALSRYKDKAVDALKSLAQGAAGLPAPVRLHIYQAMAWTNETALVPPAAAAIKDSAPEVALPMAEILKHRKSGALVPVWLEALETGSDDLSRIAALGLVANVESLKVDVIEGALKSSRPCSAAGALAVLGKMSRTYASRKAVPFLDDQREEVAVAAAEALSEMGEKVPSAKVAPLLESKTPAVAERAAKVLKQANAADLKDRYVALLSHANSHTRKAAAELLRLCAKAQPGDLLDEPAIPLLIELTRQPELATAAAGTLRLLTRADVESDSFPEWDRWWTTTKEIRTRIKEAEANFAKVKALYEAGELAGRVKEVKEAVALLDRSLELYTEISEKGFSTNTYDNECQRIQVLMRQVRTLLSGEEGD